MVYLERNFLISILDWSSIFSTKAENKSFFKSTASFLWVYVYTDIYATYHFNLDRNLRSYKLWETLAK